MKELIEKIKEKINELKEAHDEIFNPTHIRQVTCEQILRMIEDQESKPFNPAEAGFFMTETTLRILNKGRYIDILEFYFKKDSKTYLMRFFEKESKIWIQYKYTGEDKYKMLVDIIKIPNHRFGVELLKNLGVVD